MSVMAGWHLDIVINDMYQTSLWPGAYLCPFTYFIFKDSRYKPYLGKDRQYDDHYDRNAGFAPYIGVFK